jgi:pilus assembly protein FimV
VIKHLRITVSALLAVAATVSPLSAWALGLGQMEVKSQRNEPLLAEIAIVSNDPSELEALQARLASPDTFTRIGLSPPSGIVSDLQFAVALDARGRPVIRVTSAAPVQQPLLTFLVEVDWGQGRLVREYSALIDTPQTAAAPVQPPIQEAVAGSQNTIVRPADPVVGNPLESEAPTAVPLTPDAVASAPAPRPANPLDAPSPTAVPLPPSEVPATETTPAVASAPPVAPAAPLPVTSGETRVVRRGETLARIASDLGGGYSLDQTIVALLRANPEAFIGGNANRLKAGAVLRIPDGTSIAGYSADEAAVVMREQMAQWRGERRALPQPPSVAGVQPREPRMAAPTAAAPAATARPSSEARLQIVPASTSVAGRAATKSGISAGGKGDMLREQELLQTKETLAARSAEVDELKARVAELEALQAKQDQLIALKDSELAAAQQRLAGANEAKPATPTASTSEAAVLKPAESTGFGPWLGGGAAVLALGLLALFWMRRKSVAQSSAKPEAARNFDTAQLAAAIPASTSDGDAANAALTASDAEDRFESAFGPAAAQASEPEPVWSRGSKPTAMAASPEQISPPSTATPTWHDPLNVSLDEAAAAAETGRLSPTPPGLARIDLAKAYLEMGDHDTARTLLREVAALGDRHSRDEAIRLLRDLV